MDWMGWFTLAVIVAVFIALCFEHYPADMLVVFALITLWAARVLETKDALAGWSNTSLITVAALFIVVGAAEQGKFLFDGAKRLMGNGKNPQRDMLQQMVVHCLVSPFTNNTPQVAFFINVIKDWCRQHNLAPSKYMIPLSYAATMGGQLCIIGQSTNLLINGLLEAKNMAPVQFFEVAAIGGPMAFCGIMYMWLVGWWLLPDDKGGMFRMAKEHNSEFLSEVVFDSKFPLGHLTLEKQLSALRLKDATIIKVLRPTKPGHEVELRVVKNGGEKKSSDNGNNGSNGGDTNGRSSPGAEAAALLSPLHDDEQFTSIFPVTEPLQIGDRLIISADADRLISAYDETVPGVRYVSLPAPHLNGLLQDFFEVVLSQQNPFLGQPASAHEFHIKYDCQVLALRRNGETIAQGSDISMSKATLQNGDTMLVFAPQSFYEKQKLNRDFYVVNKIGESRTLALADSPLKVKLPAWTPTIPYVTEFFDLKPGTYVHYRKDYLAVGIMIVMITMSSMARDRYPTELLAMCAAGAVVLLGVLPANKARSLIQWDLVILIGASIGIGKAMDTSGLAEEIAKSITETNSSAWGILAIYHLTGILATEVINNNGCAALWFPIGRAVAKELGVSARPFVMSCMMSSTTGFMIPLGYQCHLMVYGPGGYSLKDFVKVGLGVDLIYWLVGVALIPVIWQFQDVPPSFALGK